MTSVVTGASGFVGGVLVRALLEDGQDVRAVDLHRGPSLEGLSIDFRTGDVLDPASIERAISGADVVYHLAAKISVMGDPDSSVRAINVDGVRNTARAALVSDVRRFIHCSSVHAYDLETKGPEISESSDRATEPMLPAYDRSKAAGEGALREVIEHGLNAVIVNPTGVIGPYDFAPSRTGRLFDALRRRRVPALISGGFDWVDVRDVAAAMVRAAQRGRAGENYLLPGHHRSLVELAKSAERATGVRGPRFTVPMGVARRWTFVGDWGARNTGSPLWHTTESLHALEFSPPVSGAKAESELGHRPRPFDATVADLYAWFDGRSVGLDHLPGDPPEPRS